MAEQVILDISIPLSDIQKATEEIGKMRGRVEQLKASNKELDKTSDAYTKNTLEIKKLNSEIRVNERVLIANTKAQESNEGSVEQLRAQLSKTSVEWAKLSKAERENTKEGKDLTRQKKELTDQLKALESQTGDNRRNVGNYSEGMKKALQSSNLLKGGVLGLNTTMAANPIGAIVALFVLFKDKVTAAQGIVDKFNSVIEPMNAMFERLVGLVQELISGGFSSLVKFFQDPIGAIKSFGEEMGKAAEQGSRLAQLTIEIEDAQNALIITEGKLKREFEEQKFLVEDLTLTNEERTKAAENAIKSVQDLEAARLEVLNKEIEQAEIRASLNDTDRAAQKELNELLARRDDLAAESIAKQKEVRNQLNNVQKSITAEEEKQQKERLALSEERASEELRIAEELAQKRTEIAAREIKRNNDLYLLGLKERLLAEQITREEYDQALYERELQLLELQKAARIINGQSTIELDNQIADLKIANLQKIQNVEKQSTKATNDLKQTELDTGLEVGKGLVNVTKSVAGENVALQKAASLAAVGINIAQSITKALAETGPIAGPILSAIATAIGAVQSARIRATPQNFADGVIGLNGPGTSTSDSIPANLSRGESVITAKATQAYAPLLAQLESNVGNRPNFQLGNRRFANGIISAGNLPAISSTRSETRAENKAIDLMNQAKIFVSVTEFQEKQTELQDARRMASIVE